MEGALMRRVLQSVRKTQWSVQSTGVPLWCRVT